MAYNFVKKEILAQVFPSEYCENSKKNTFLYRTPLMAASDCSRWLCSMHAKPGKIKTSGTKRLAPTRPTLITFTVRQNVVKL